jgi:multidrug efflux pump subunit AcrB
MLNRLLEHHVLANLAFLLVMVLGWLAYVQLPREQDPSVNFNWVEIWTYWPGSSADDVEKRVTEPLEEGLKRVADVRFISSVSRENASTIVVRFEDLSSDAFDDRVDDLRREIAARIDSLPDGAQQPEIIEVTSANVFPTATVVAYSPADAVNLQRHAQKILIELERLDGVDNVLTIGATDPELHVDFLPERLIGLGVSPVDLADSVSAYFRDLAAGNVAIGDQKWLLRLEGTSDDPSVLGEFPILTALGEIPLRAVADVKSGIEEPQELARFENKPAVIFLVSKKEKANNLELLAAINEQIEARNRLAPRTGVTLALLDDQTASTRKAIGVMEQNAVIGLFLVVAAVGVFLGWRVALITSVGIPFVLAGTFLAVMLIGETLNTTVLLGIVISLGMLVDDAVVVVEAISFHVARGARPLDAARRALKEVSLPVTTAVFTTIAAFLPLILMPGVLGDFMRVVPVVVTLALLLSLIEAFWILPAHMVSLQPRVATRGRLAAWRARVVRGMKRAYLKALGVALRRPAFSLAFALALMVGAGLSLAMGAVKVDFFATDLYRLFYVNVVMAPGTSLEKTLETVSRVERVVAEEIGAEGRGIVSYAGQQLTDKEILVGDERGQVFVSLVDDAGATRSVDELIEAVRKRLQAVPGPGEISFVRRSTGPPVTKPISIKVRGDDIGEIREAVAAVRDVLAETPGVGEISDDDHEGGYELLIRLNPDAITRAKLHPQTVARLLRLFGAGEQVADMQHQGERLFVRVRVSDEPLRNIDEFLGHPISLPDGGEIALGELLNIEERKADSNIRHQDFRRAVTVEAEIDPAVTDTLRANARVAEAWQGIATRFPGVALDFSGELDDIEESLGAMTMLFLFGLGLIYIILGAQFRSYAQPLLVLSAVPMAFVGVVFGLGLSGNPLSLFTLYGVVALAGIAANDAIVLMAAANSNLARSGSVATAIVMAARRRFMPIIITSATTIAGLFSLATGLGGESLMWGPVATAIVWGLVFSTPLTLFVVPVAYTVFRRTSRREAPAGGGLPLPQPLRAAGAARLWRVADRLVAPGRARVRAELARALDTAPLRDRYATAVEAMRQNDLETPVRLFEQLARERPESLELNILAAQANLRLMDARGWDVGYAARARRFLAMARSTAGADPRVASLSMALDDLDDAAAQGQGVG